MENGSERFLPRFALPPFEEGVQRLFAGFKGLFISADLRLGVPLSPIRVEQLRRIVLLPARRAAILGVQLAVFGVKPTFICFSICAKLRLIPILGQRFSVIEEGVLQRAAEVK